MNPSLFSLALLITLICITHHSRLLSDQGPTPQILGYKADGCCWSRERQAAYSRSFPKMWEGGVEVHSYYRSLGRWLYNWLIYIITFTFIASTNISIDILMFLTLESMFQLIHTNVWKKTPQEYFVPINSFHILSLLLQYYQGMFLGFFQMAVWLVWDPWWSLALGGAIVGYLTDWFALKVFLKMKYRSPLWNEFKPTAAPV